VGANAQRAIRPRIPAETATGRVLTLGARSAMIPSAVIQMAERDDLRRFRYAAASTNIFGLLLSVGTWAFRVWYPPTHLSLTNFTRTLGAACWLFGLTVLIISWIVEGSAGEE
jgi:hypothetical protein